MADLPTSTLEQLESGADRVIVAAEYPHLSTARLFAAFTDANLLTQWWSPTAETDPRLGGSYHIWWDRLGKHLRGTYREFEPGTRLVFTWKWDQEPNLPERVVEIDFAPANNRPGSSLKLTHGVYGAGAAEAEDRKGHLEGWLYFLPLLNRIDNT